jgi:coenzyme F420 hydrogenase subunit beta
VEISHQSFNNETIPELCESWGPILEVWEGYALDRKIRFKGSSGGAATALALFCLEKERAFGVLQTGTRPEDPLHNVPVLGKSKEELLACTGSRYSPAAPCERFDWIREASRPIVFIGKPCDVVALRKSQAADPKINENISLAISIFCAGTPTTEGAHNILGELGVKHGEVEELRYRGCGWPGMTSAKVRGGGGRTHQMTYQESWGNILSNHVQFRCRLCPDATGEFADVSCGDPWYREIESGEHGWSLVLARTRRGREVLQEAVKADYVKLERVGPSVVPQSQKALLTRRRHLWGRLLMMQMMRVPVPRYTGFSLFKNWLKLSALEKLRSLAGTLKRIMLRGWMRPLKAVIKSDGLQEANYPEKPKIDSEGCES